MGKISFYHWQGDFWCGKEGRPILSSQLNVLMIRLAIDALTFIHMTCKFLLLSLLNLELRDKFGKLSQSMITKMINESSL